MVRVVLAGRTIPFLSYLKMLRTAIRQTVSDKYPAYLPSAFKFKRIFIFSKSCGVLQEDRLAV